LDVPGTTPFETEREKKKPRRVGWERGPSLMEKEQGRDHTCAYSTGGKCHPISGGGGVSKGEKTGEKKKTVKKDEKQRRESKKESTGKNNKEKTVRLGKKNTRTKKKEKKKKNDQNVIFFKRVQPEKAKANGTKWVPRRGVVFAQKKSRVWRWGGYRATLGFKLVLLKVRLERPPKPRRFHDWVGSQGWGAQIQDGNLANNGEDNQHTENRGKTPALCCPKALSGKSLRASTHCWGGGGGAF